MKVSLLEKAKIGFHAALDKKAIDVIIFDNRAISTATDFFMICSGGSTRQVQAIADEVMDKLRAKGVKPSGVEGYEVSRWILLDYSDIVVHVFHEDTRKYYDIERLWEGAPRVDITSSKKSGGLNGQKKIGELQTQTRGCQGPSVRRRKKGPAGQQG